MHTCRKNISVKVKVKVKAADAGNRIRLGDFTFECAFFFYNLPALVLNYKYIYKASAFNIFSIIKKQEIF